MKRLLSKLLIHLLRKVDIAVLNENCSEYDVIEIDYDPFIQRIEIHFDENAAERENSSERH